MNEFKITQDYIVYQAKKEGVFPIKETDWNRLKRLIQSIIPHKKIFQILYSIATGIFGSSIFSLIAFYIVNTTPAWAFVSNWIITISSFVLGISLIIIDNQQNEIISRSTNDVLSEMSVIEKSFDKPE